jgi:hypothetical protein
MALLGGWKLGGRTWKEKTSLEGENKPLKGISWTLLYLWSSLGE